METRRFESVRRFLDHVEGRLMENEATNNLPLGMLYKLAKAAPPSIGENAAQPYFASVEDGERVALVMVMTPPHNLVLGGGDAPDDNQLAEVVTSTVDLLQTSGVHLPGVLGPRKVTEAVAKRWAETAHCTTGIQMEQRIYKLERVRHSATDARGRLRTASPSDISLVADWVYDFSEIALEPRSREAARQLAERVIADSSLYLWEDGLPVSMANISRPLKNGSTVNLVYTPPEHRNKGYATACVAALSQLILDRGRKFCTLYTDLANPTSNSIYRKIGYDPIEDAVVYEFK